MHHKYFIVVLILLAIVEIKNAEFVTLAITTISVISSIVTIYLAAEQQFSPDETANRVNDNIFDLSQTIANRLDKLNSELNNIEIFIKNYLAAKDYSDQYEHVHDYIDRIDFLYKESQKWARYLKENKTWDLDSKIDQMISLDLDYPQAVLFQLGRYFFQIRRRPKPTFLHKFYDAILQDTNSTLCDQDVTPHYQLFSFYKKLIYTEVKGFAAMAFSYLWKNGSTSEMEAVQSKRIKSIIEYTKLFQEKMKFSKNFIRRCNAKEKEELIIIGNKTYASFNNMYYTTVLDMSNFMLYTENPKPTFRMCQLHNECTGQSHSYDKICPGWISNCKEVWSIDYCERNEEDQTSTKNYYWIKYTELDTRKEKILGDKNHPCKSTQLSNEVLGGSPIFKKTTEHYPVYCDCVDENIRRQSKSIRAFSFLWVATGARIVAQDRMIHIQLREARLLPNGGIDKESERWIPLPTFKYRKNFPNVAIYANGTKYQLKENIDFGPIHNHHDKEICLQKIISDEELLLTDVRFDYDFNTADFGKRFRLKAKYVGFNYRNGTITHKMERKGPSCKDLPELILNNPDDPLKFNTHPHDSKENQFITIRASDLIKDASQTTIPFFDLLEIAPKTSVPLNGIELFHKGQIDGTSGGYISLKLYPLNLTMYMNPPKLLPDMSNLKNITMPEFDHKKILELSSDETYLSNNL
ncbi:uncharacterized protein LOC122860581 [Aphidius gifuensis]|uniref:uncharacterized protein LOC122860581 n=1 Tax=Aphidius gifuensis TaxID=684658 RepID=UPI001CDC8FDE|nr:uncharacterized protein LOC122860581 [Aphidius gifuensis]